MAGPLNDGNCKKTVGMVGKQGFAPGFWEKWASSAAKISSIPQMIKELKKAGVPASGDPAKATDVTPAQYAILSAQFKKAKGKCNKKFTRHTIELCDEYIRLCDKYYKEASTAEKQRDKMDGQVLKELDKCFKLIEAAVKTTDDLADRVDGDEAQIDGIRKQLKTMKPEDKKKVDETMEQLNLLEKRHTKYQAEAKTLLKKTFPDLIDQLKLFEINKEALHRIGRVKDWNKRTTKAGDTQKLALSVQSDIDHDLATVRVLMKRVAKYT